MNIKVFFILKIKHVLRVSMLFAESHITEMKIAIIRQSVFRRTIISAMQLSMISNFDHLHFGNHYFGQIDFRRSSFRYLTLDRNIRRGLLQSENGINLLPNLT
jgi:hypothetical protein